MKSTFFSRLALVLVGSALIGSAALAQQTSIPITVADKPAAGHTATLVFGVHPTATNDIDNAAPHLESADLRTFR